MAFDPDAYLQKKSRGGFDPDAYLASKSAPADETDNLKDLGVVATRGVLMGARPFVAGAGGAIGGAIERLGRDDDSGLLDKIKSLPEAMDSGFITMRADARAEEAELQKRRPGLVLAGDIGGAVLTAPFTGGAALAKGAGMGARLAKAARMGTGFGAAQALGQADTAGEAATIIAAGTALGPAAELGLAGAAKGAKALPGAAAWTAKKGMTVFLGPSKEAIDTYLQRAELIRGARSAEEIKNGIDEVMEGYLGAVKSAEMSKVEAKEGLRLIEDQIRDATQKANFSFGIKKADIREQLRNARSAVDAAFGEEKAKLSAIKSPIQLADDVAGAVQDLKAQVSRGSAESYKILDADPNAYSVRNAGPILMKMANEMNIQPFERAGLAAAGSVKPGAPVTAQTAGVQNELRAFAQRLMNTPQRIPARELKKILQQIDASEKAMYGQPGFDGRVSQAYKMVRSTIDQQVKDANTDYAAKMAEVAEKSDLLSSVLERFSDPRATVSKLNSIAGRTAGGDRELLARLGKSTGNDFETAIQQFGQAQTTLKDPRAMEGIKRGLPEYKTLLKTEAKNYQLGRPESAAANVQSELNSLGLKERLALAQEGLLGSETKLAIEAARLKPFRALSPARTQAIVENLLRDPKMQNIESRNALRALSGASEQDFMRMIGDLKTQRSFSGEYRNGSRNVVLGGIIGFITGGLPGVGGGAVVGSAIDRYGPKMAQKILDGYLRVSESPTLQKIQSLAIPAEAKEFMKKEFFGSGPAGASAAVYRNKTENAVENSQFSSPIRRRMQQLEEAAKNKRGS
jgi:hypothetical protein